MKFYYFPVAPNPTRLRTYIREKGIELEEIEATRPSEGNNGHQWRRPNG